MVWLGKAGQAVNERAHFGGPFLFPPSPQSGVTPREGLRTLSRMPALPLIENLEIAQGKTYSRPVRWEKEPFLYRPITGIAKTAPVRITAVGHGIPDGWRVAVVSVQGMRQICADNPPKESQYHRCTVIDADTVDINEINAAGYSTYTSGGYLQLYTPASLAGCVARLTIKDKVGGTVLLALTSPSSGIVLDNTGKTITFTITATVTAAFTWTKGVYELEIEDGSGVVTGLLRGTVTIKPKEIAT